MRQKSNSEWLTALRERGRGQEVALAELRLGLLGAIRAYLTKHYAIQGSLHSAETQHLAEDCTQEAILIIQAKLDGFRGESQFMTWAFSIAIRVALGELRRRRWRQATGAQPSAERSVGSTDAAHRHRAHASAADRARRPRFSRNALGPGCTVVGHQPE
jgi:RNA polymerase sigma-70 factor (ECF subfamily)